MDMEHSRTEMRNQRLIQRVAMLEADLREFQKDKSDKAAAASGLTPVEQKPSKSTQARQR